MPVNGASKKSKNPRLCLTTDQDQGAGRPRTTSFYQLLRFVLIRFWVVGVGFLGLAWLFLERRG